MDLEAKLATALCQAHPGDAAGVLEGFSVSEAERALAATPEEVASSVLERSAPQRAAEILDACEGERAAALVAGLHVTAAAAALRRMQAAHRDRLLAMLPRETVRPLRAVLRFPEGTAGALADPQMLALPEDLTVRDALESVRAAPDSAYYNVYVIERERQRLVGALNLRELLLASPGERLRAIMRTELVRLQASADRRAVASHRGWREFRSIPVVDDDGVFVGAVRYRTLRRLEEELRRRPAQATSTAGALAELFRTGAAGLLDAMTVGGTGGDSHGA